MLSSFGEFFLFYKNLGDIDSFSHLGFGRRALKRFKLALSVIKNKVSIDPIQDTIIVENMMAVTGVCLPIFTSFLCYFTGLNFFDKAGSVLNGFLQIYLGYLISSENIKILAGQSLDPASSQRMKNIIQSVKKVASVEEVKSEYIGNDTLKMSATIVYDAKNISQNVINQLNDDIDRLYPDKKSKEKVHKLLEKITEITLKETSLVISNLENQIQQEFSQVVEVDLEVSKSNIIKK